eukprot:1862049-Pyramimonas_sp.AAC.2
MRGIWAAPSVSTGRGGTAGGVAVLAPKHVLLTKPPMLRDPVLYPGRVAHLGLSRRRHRAD